MFERVIIGSGNCFSESFILRVDFVLVDDGEVFIEKEVYVEMGKFFGEFFSTYSVENE